MSVSTPSEPAPGALQATFCATLVDEWVRAEVTDAVVCPGSRSTPLALALADRLSVHVRLDERGAGFFALGLAVASRRPVVVLTTSGTAAAELHPSVLEAHHSGVPLLVVTADRPVELHGVGAPQTIDQHRLFGPAVRFFADPGVPGSNRGHWRSLAARLVAEATVSPAGPGPVHLNVAFAEPLVARPLATPPGRAAGRPWHVVAASPPRAPRQAVEALARHSGGRVVVVAGAGAGPPRMVFEAAARLGWPLLADGRSRARLAAPGVVAAADAIARSEGALSELRPDAVVVLGAPWASRALGAAVARWAGEGTEVVAADPFWRWRDPDRVVTTMVAAEPGGFLAEVAQCAGPCPGVNPYAEAWQAAEDAAQGVFEAELDEEGRLDEPRLARWLLRLLPEEAVVVAASSMPVRDLEWFGPRLERPPEMWANRGVNGIDGVTSTALGCAAAGRRVVALVGDLAFFHDLSALVVPTPSGASLPAVVVVADNGGGGIFSFLPQARLVAAERFEALFATPMAAPVAETARGLGAVVAEVATVGELAEALADPPAGVVVVRAAVPSRGDNVARHEALNRVAVQAIEAAVRGA